MYSVENDEILKTLSELVIGGIVSGKYTKGDIYDIVMGKISPAVLSAYFACPLFFTCLLINERVTDSVKYTINNPNLMKKTYLFFPLNLKNMHWSLVIVMP